MVCGGVGGVLGGGGHADCGDEERGADADADGFPVERVCGLGVDDDCGGAKGCGVAENAADIVVVGEGDADGHADGAGRQIGEGGGGRDAASGEDAAVEVKTCDGVEDRLGRAVERGIAALGEDRQAGDAAFLDEDGEGFEPRAGEEDVEDAEPFRDEDAFAADAVALLDGVKDGDAWVVDVGDGDRGGRAQPASSSSRFISSSSQRSSAASFSLWRLAMAAVSFAKRSGSRL